MNIKEIDLPGIGRKYTVHTAEGDYFVIIIHHSGRREIYLMGDPDADEPLYTLNMNDEESRRVGSILVGADYQPVSDEKMEFMQGNVFIDWVKVSAASPLANKSLKEGNVKTTTGATVISIKRGDQVIGSPDADEVLLPGDLIMVVGKRSNIRSLAPLCGDDSCGTV